MAVIIISRGSYSHGEEVAKKTAQKLGYDCISREVLIEVSKEFNIPEVKLLRAIRDAPAALERYTFGREKYIAYIRARILEYMAKDNVVYHGFAGQFFVKDVPHVLKVRILADMKARIACMMRRENVSNEKEAYKMVQDVDEERRGWALKLYGMDIWDCRLYDLIVNVGKIDVDNAVEMICNTAKTDRFQTTPESQKQMDQLLREARQQLKELSGETAPFFEPLRGGPWKR
jgi:cytidylate kinase